MAHPRRWRVLQDLRDGGAELVESATVDAIEADAVRYRTGDVEHRAPADTVIVTTGLAANPSLADALREAGIEPQVIGDVTGVGYIEGAIHRTSAATGRRTRPCSSTGWPSATST